MLSKLGYISMQNVEHFFTVQKRHSFYLKLTNNDDGSFSPSFLLDEQRKGLCLFFKKKKKNDEK